MRDLQGSASCRPSPDARSGLRRVRIVSRAVDSTAGSLSRGASSTGAAAVRKDDRNEVIIAESVLLYHG